MLYSERMGEVWKTIDEEILCSCRNDCPFVWMDGENQI